MATTVTYKGATLATVENQTKTLQTKGTWVEDDFTLVDVTQGGGEWTTDGIASGTEPSGTVTVTGTTIARGAFAYSPITGVVAPNVTTLGEAAFTRSNIVDVTFPSATSVGGSCFQNCSNLRRLILGGSGRFASSYWVQQCPSLVEFRCPNASHVGVGGLGFNGDTSLDIFDIGYSESLYISWLPSTAPLSVIIMRYSTKPVTFAGGSDTSLNSTAFAEGGTGGTIYIPKVLYDHLGDGTSLDYKSATTWSAIDARGTVTWATIEGSEWE